MLGYHKRNREKRQLKRDKAELEQKRSTFEAESPTRMKEEADFKKNQMNENIEASKNQRRQAREEGREYAEGLISRKVQGLDPGERNAMQYEANKGIQRSTQQANRKLLGQQAQRGIGGRSGVAYAQQKDLNRMGMEARGGVERDLNKLDADLAMKKLAAMFNIEQGEAAQAGLDRQLASDELRYDEDQKRARKLEEKFSQLFSRI